KGAVQRPLVRSEQRRGDAIKLGSRVVLNLTVGLDFALQLNQLLGMILDVAEQLQSHRPHHDQENRDGEEPGKQLDLDASRYSRNQADKRVHELHYCS